MIFGEDFDRALKVFAAFSVIGIIAAIIWIVKLLFWLFSHVTIIIN